MIMLLLVHENRYYGQISSNNLFSKSHNIKLFLKNYYWAIYINIFVLFTAMARHRHLLLMHGQICFMCVFLKFRILMHIFLTFIQKFMHNLSKNISHLYVKIVHSKLYLVTTELALLHFGNYPVNSSFSPSPQYNDGI